VKWFSLLIAVVIGGPAVLKNVDLKDLFGQEAARQSAP
jgi:hypothetical protein